MIGPDEGRQSVLEAAIAPLRELEAAPLPRQLVHCDITDVNTLVTGGGLTGLIDFGDLTDTWRVCELAVACHAVIAGHTDDALQAIIDVVAGYDGAARLSELEADALWPLILGRAAACAALDVRQLRLTPDSNYVREASDNDWLALHDVAGAARRPADGGDPDPVRIAAGARRCLAADHR